MPNKLTDAEITVKALKEILELMLCDGDLQRTSTISHTIDLINRLQARVEGLKLELADTKRDLQIVLDNSISAKLPHCVLCGKGAILTKSLKEYDELIADISAEAYKEFAERAKDKAYTYSDITGYQSTVVDVNEIDGVYEELVGED